MTVTSIIFLTFAGLILAGRVDEWWRDRQYRQLVAEGEAVRQADPWERWELDAIEQDRVLFDQNPLAFWNDPNRYGSPRLSELREIEREAYERAKRSKPVPVEFGTNKITGEFYMRPSNWRK